MVFVTLTADALEGTAGKEKALMQIPRNQVQSVERRETSVAKTVTLVTSIVLLTLLTVGLSNAAFIPPGTY